MLILQANLELLARDPDLTPAGLRVLLSFWAGSARKGWWGKVPKIEAELLGISLATFYRARGELIDKGLVRPPKDRNVAYRILSVRHPWRILYTTTAEGQQVEEGVRKYDIVPGVKVDLEDDDEASAAGNDSYRSGNGKDADEGGDAADRRRRHAENSRKRRRMFPNSANS